MTIFAIIISIIIAFLTPPAIDFVAVHSAFIMLVGGTAILLATVFLNTFILMPLQYLEQQLIPNLMNLVRRDRPLKFGRVILYLFTLVSYLCVALVSRIENIYYKDWFFLFWLIFFGIALDVFRDSWHRLVNFLNPSFLVKHFSHDAIRAIQNDQSSQLLSGLDSLAEIGVRSVEKSKLALSTQTLQTFPSIIQTFLECARSISHTSSDIKEQEKGEGDEESYTIFYLLQRLELINDKALRDRQETVCRQMIMAMGKIIVQCAKYDLSLVAFPTHFLTKFGLKAQQHHFDEVTVLTTSTLLEIAKTILRDIDITYAELQEPFRSIITGLEAIAKSTFKKHKDTSIKVLIQPFIDLKGFFRTEKMANHRDTPVILQEIDRILEEFSVLEQVMQSIPPILDSETPEGPETK
jgi:hypothetical protein